MKFDKKLVLKLPIIIFFLLYLTYTFLKPKKGKWEDGKRQYSDTITIESPIDKLDGAFRLSFKDSTILLINEKKLKINNLKNKKIDEWKSNDAYYATIINDSIIYLDSKKKLLFKILNGKIIDSVEFKGTDGELAVANNDVYSYGFKLEKDSFEFYLQNKIGVKLIDLSKVFYNELKNVLPECKLSIAESKIVSNNKIVVFIPTKIGSFIIYNIQNNKYTKVRTIDKREFIQQEQLKFDVPGVGSGYKCAAVQSNEYIQTSACIQQQTLYILQDIIIGSKKDNTLYCVIDLYDVSTFAYIKSIKIKIKDKSNEIVQIDCDKDYLYLLMFDGSVCKVKYNNKATDL